jgi:hypothetical protein
MKYFKLEPGQLSVIQKLSTQICYLKETLLEESSKMSRIQGSSNYNRALTYHVTATQNVLSIVHTGTTANGVETITETFTYVDPAINGSNVTNIAYS